MLGLKEILRGTKKSKINKHEEQLIKLREYGRSFALIRRHIDALGTR
jgi:hypothetical protein